MMRVHSFSVGMPNRRGHVIAGSRIEVSLPEIKRSQTIDGTTRNARATFAAMVALREI